MTEAANEPKYERILRVAIEAGCAMLQNGGEVYRAEETMSRISLAYGASECDSYATPTTMMLTIYDEGGHPYTTMKRVHERGVDLDKVARVNAISRNVAAGRWDIDRTHRELQAIHDTPKPRFWVPLAASAFIGGAFTLVYGGTFADILPGMACGALLRLLVCGLQRLRMGQFFINMAGGALATFAAWVFFTLGLASSWAMLASSALMLLVPGLLLTNAFRDIVAGDLVSGVSRTIEAITVAAALACGAAMVYFLLLHGGGVAV